MRQAIWEPAARRELREALLFLAERDGSAALKLRQRIEAAVARLRLHSTGRPGRIPSILEKSVTGTPYVLAYTIVADKLHLLRLIHQRRNWPSGAWPET